MPPLRVTMSYRAEQEQLANCEARTLGAIPACLALSNFRLQVDRFRHQLGRQIGKNAAE